MKGDVTTAQLVGWGITLIIFALTGSAYSIHAADAKIEQVKADVAQNVTSIAVLGVRGEQYDRDIARINAKLDALLEANNVSPSVIEKKLISEQTSTGELINTQ